MLNPSKRTYYLSIILLFLLAPSCITACIKPDWESPVTSIQEKDTLVSEFYHFLESETDLGWQKQFVTINYKGALEGFNVRILWIPRDEARLDHISGPGIMEFTDPIKSTRFTIKNIDLAISMERIGIDSEEQRQSPLDKSFELQFNQMTVKDGFDGNITEPFFFYDVDFDDKIELIVTQYGYGLQNSNTYKAYKLIDFGLENAAIQITDKEPFSLFNDFTEFNKQEKTISIGIIFGGGNTQTSIYKKINQSEFKLISIEKYTYDEKITFELVDSEMVEVKREKVN